MQLIQVLSKVVQKFLRQRKKLPNVNTLEDVVKLLRESKNIMVLTGAGVCNIFICRKKTNFLLGETHNFILMYHEMIRFLFHAVFLTFDQKTAFILDYLNLTWMTHKKCSILIISEIVLKSFIHLQRLFFIFFDY